MGIPFYTDDALKATLRSNWISGPDMTFDSKTQWAVVEHVK